jgi:hypothetical protein
MCGNAVDLRVPARSEVQASCWAGFDAEFLRAVARLHPATGNKPDYDHNHDDHQNNVN